MEKTKTPVQKEVAQRNSQLQKWRWWTSVSSSTRILGPVLPTAESRESVALLLATDFVDMGFLAIIVWFVWHFQVYAVPLGGMCIRQRLAIGGSGSTYVYGYVDSHVSDVKTKKECLEFVTNSTYRFPKQETIPQMLHYFHGVYFITDCLYQWLCYLIINYVIQWYLNNNFTLLKLCSFKTSNTLGHKVHRKLVMFFIFTKETGTARKPEKSALPVQRHYWAVLGKPTCNDFSFIEVDGVFGNIHT